MEWASGSRRSAAAAAADGEFGAGVRLAAYIVVAALLLSPLLSARVPPLVDYPNHLARMWILVHGKEIPQLAANYRVDWRILPDLAMDLVVPALSRVMPVEQAGRVFIALTMLALVGGTATLHRVLYGRWRIWPLCSALFVYNAALFWGFLGCLFATGVGLFAFSGWIATQHWRIGRRIACFSVVATVLLFLHLFAFGLYALLLFAYEIGRSRNRARPAREAVSAAAFAGSQVVPGVALWYVSVARGGYTSTLYGGLPAKLYAVLAPFNFGWQPAAFDGLVATVVCAALAVAVLARSVRLRPEMRLPLIAIIAAALLMPNRMSGSWGADIRLPVTLPFVVIAATRLEISRRRIIVLSAAAALTLLSLRVWSVSLSWRDYDRWFDEFESASAAIDPGARLLVVQSPMPETGRRLRGLPAAFGAVQPMLFAHLAALAVIDRAAFFPYLFTGWSTIDVTPRNARAAQREGWPATPDELIRGADPRAKDYAKYIASHTDMHGELPYWRDWPETFDFVLWIDFDATRRFALPQLEAAARGGFFEIYRVVRRWRHQSARGRSGVRAD